MKRKLLFAIVALTCSIGLWAQTDVTYYLTNPSFETGDMTGWSTLREGVIQTPELAEPVYATSELVADFPLSDSDGSYVCNYYMWVWTWNEHIDGIRQTVSNLPAGTYTLTAVLGGWNGWDLTLDVNGTNQTQTMTADDTGVSFSVTFTMASAGDAVITASTAHTGSNEWAAGYLKADNFKLSRLPDSPVDVTSTYITNANLVSDYYSSSNNEWWPVYGVLYKQS